MPAPQAYFDTSVLVKRYVEEAGSTDADLVRTSLRHRSSVDEELAPRRVRRVVGREIDHGRHDLRHGPHAAERNPLEPSLHDRAVRERAVEHLRVDRARMDGVAADL